MTVVGPLFLRREEALKLLGTLKRKCGSGGTLKPDQDGAGEPCFLLEIQGDLVERVLRELTGLGYPAKRSGG